MEEPAGGGAVGRPRGRLQGRGARRPQAVGALALRCLRSGGGVEVVCEADQVTPSYVNYVEVVGEEGNIFASMLDGLATLRL